MSLFYQELYHDDVIKWRYWPFVRWIHWSPVNFPHKGHWREALMFPLISVWINGCVNNREVGDLRSDCTHYDVVVMTTHLKIVRHLLRFHCQCNLSWNKKYHFAQEWTVKSVVNQYMNTCWIWLFSSITPNHYIQVLPITVMLPGVMLMWLQGGVKSHSLKARRMTVARGQTPLDLPNGHQYQKARHKNYF